MPGWDFSLSFFLNHLLIDHIMKATQYFKDLKDKVNIAVYVGQQQYG